MQSKDIRETFLEFFESKGHKRLPSASLIPSDPSVLLTIAGMLPFKPYFLGQEESPFKRITTCQRCVRVNDLEQVGKTSRHHTFFEMLGNFSFGDYFKEEAIAFAWELLIEKFKLQKEKLWIAVFREDDEAEKLWRQYHQKIVRLDEENNFWSAGPTGPCGPCSEIYYDFGEELACGPTCQPGCDCERFLEIWNLVFIQYNRDEAGNLNPLPKKNIDTGMGLERIARVLQGVKSNFETDLFKPLIAGIESGDKNIIADHCRAMTYLIADGVTPSNEGRGYVLRRIIRRAIVHGGKELSNICEEVISRDPLLNDQRRFITTIVDGEENNFERTYNSGLDLIEKIIAENRVSGAEVFKLHDTYGFPFELTREIMSAKGFTFDEAEFHRKMEEQRERARANVRIAKGGEVAAAKNEIERSAMARNHTATHLLHAALRQVLGKHVFQSGSLVDPKYLRFDFSNPSAMTKNEIKEVEDLVNQKIRENIKVEIFEKSFDEAKKMGAMALFGEKYGERVRVIKINNFSTELCGGTHVNATGEIGLFLIISEKASSAGVRRIEAVTGEAVLEYEKQRERELEELKRQEEAKAKDKEKNKKRQEEAGKSGDLVIREIREIKGIKVAAHEAEGLDLPALRILGDRVKDQLKSGIILLASSFEGKAFFLAIVSDDLVSKGYDAGKLVKIMAQTAGGGGGGRANKAEAGGKDPTRIKEALRKAIDLL